MKPIRLRQFGLFILLSFILLNYSNCSSSKMSYDENPAQFSSSLSPLTSICSQTENDLFSMGYHQFLKTNCNTCHVSGPGKGTFAHPDAAIALGVFQTLGVDKVSSMAVSDAHNYPYTGSHNLETINNLKEQWKTYEIEKAKCDQDPTSTPNPNQNTFHPNFTSIKKVIPAIIGKPGTIDVNGSQMSIVSYNTATVTFDLDQDFSSLSDKALPVTAGASLSVSVTGFSNPSGATGYLIQMPKLKTGTTSLKFTGMHVLINGRPIGYSYTFQHIEKSIFKQTEVMLSGGSMLALGPISENDQISLTIGNIEVVDMPPPLAAPTVQFDLAAATLVPTDFGYANPYKITITRSGDTSNPVSVTVAKSGNEALTTVAKGLTDANGRNRFNWDYRFKSSLSVTFFPGETTKFVEVIFSDDLRDEATKTLTLNLADPFGSTLGTNKTLVITIPDFNNPNVGSITFSQLMSTGGILEMNCVRCHNSADRQGGYDMTDYQEMVAKGVIVPGDLTPNNHKMYRRMNPDAPGAGSITPMPLDGFLIQDLTLIVEDWIKAGAKNN